MKIKNYIPVLLPGIPVALTAATQQKQEAQRPNIVVIMADDLGTNELSCYGGKNLKTPNIDALANEGILLHNNYASASMSVPIRASLFTGLYPARHGSYQNHKKSFSNIKSITHYMPEIGYRVGRTGKTHTTPLSVYQFEEIPGFEVNCVSQTANFTTDGIDSFMNRDSQPFCLFVCSTHPHVPWTWGDQNEFDPAKVILPPNTIDNENTRRLFRNYLAEIRALDNEVGAVVDVLKKNGTLDNTLIIFLGEQGPQFPYGKWTCYRYGQNSAFIARYPAKIKAKTTSDAIVQYEDILPTLIEFANGKPVTDIDGRSFLPVLYGKKKEHRKWSYGIHNNIPEGTAYPIRSIQDKRFKLILNLTPEVDYFEKHMMNVKSKDQVWASWLKSAETSNIAKMLAERFVKRPAVEFYDLKTDPWEQSNLATEKGHAKRIAKMQQELSRWMNEQGDTGILMDK
jgi:uncharacterized sulfatase